MGWLQFILRFIGGGGLSGLASELRKANADRLAAANDSERMAAEERIAQVANQMEAQTRGDGSWMAKAMRALFGLVVLVYFAKLLIFDKVLGLGATDALGGFADWTARTVVVFYFLDASIGKLRR